MFLVKTNELEVLNTIMHSYSKYSDDYMDIKWSLFEKEAFSLSKNLSELFNERFTNASFPDSLKAAKF